MALMKLATHYHIGIPPLRFAPCTEEAALQAYAGLTEIRPCGPKKDAIRGATYDLLDDRGFDTFSHLPDISYSMLSQEQKADIRSKLS